jgi:hypothetical protein
MGQAYVGKGYFQALQQAVCLGMYHSAAKGECGNLEKEGAMLDHQWIVRQVYPKREISTWTYDDLEIGSLDSPQFFVQHWNTFIRGDADCPVDPVVGYKHSVCIKPLEDCLHFRGKTADVDLLLQPNAFAHSR